MKDDIINVLAGTTAKLITMQNPNDSKEELVKKALIMYHKEVMAVRD